jgi:hypothetical protein
MRASSGFVSLPAKPQLIPNSLALSIYTFEFWVYYCWYGLYLLPNKWA